MAASERLNEAGKQAQHLATLPIGQPDPILKKTWRKRDAHGKASRRALTAAEIAEQALKLRERQDSGQKTTAGHARLTSPVRAKGNLVLVWCPPRRFRPTARALRSSIKGSCIPRCFSHHLQHPFLSPALCSAAMHIAAGAG
jgi:hypothetical protein